MHWSVVFLSVMFAMNLLADLSFSKEQEKPGVEKTASAVQKVLAEGDLSGVNLRVEGASFRKFKLFFPSANTTALSPAAKTSFDTIRKIIERDLAIVGSFDLVNAASIPAAHASNDAVIRQQGAEGVSRMSLSLNGDVVKAIIEHKNLITGKASKKTYEAKLANTRRLSHQLAQSIFEEFIGLENLFMLQIVAIKRDRNGGSQVVIVDFDGENESIVVDGKWLKSTPSFSPDGKNVLYAVHTRDGQAIVEQPIGSKQFQFRIKKDGLNIEPRVFPDNSGMLVTLSFQGNANIFRTDRLGKLVGTAPITGVGDVNRGPVIGAHRKSVSGESYMNLSPSISADGKEVAFVSDRSGTPQIYVQSLVDPTKRNATRVTFKGNYNQTPQFSPDGKMIAFTGRDERKVFDIFLLERATERISRVTQNQGRNEEPYFTPSGRFVIFTSERDGKKPDIYIASLKGDHQYRLTDAKSNAKTLGYYSPAVKPKP